VRIGADSRTVLRIALYFSGFMLILMDIAGDVRMSSRLVRLTVLLKPDEAERLDAYCEESGHKKSTLIARLVRDHLDHEDQRKTPRSRRQSR
jgi:hypothetical protein